MSENAQHTWFENRYSPGFFYGGKHKKEVREILLKSSVDRISKGCVLDIGFGDTSELTLLSEYIDVNYVVGVDVYKKKMKSMAHELKDFGTYRIFPGDINDLDFEEKYFDAVVALNSFYFVQDEDKVTERVSAILKKKGCFILSFDVFEGGETKREKQYNKNNVSYKKFSEEDLKDLLQRHHFRDINTFYTDYGHLAATAVNH